MKQETIKAVEQKLNTLRRKPSRRNPLAGTLPPGYPRVGPYATPRAMDIGQTAIQICAAIRNFLIIPEPIDELAWNNKIMSLKNLIGSNADKSWLYCEEKDAEDIIKTVCEMEAISVPPQFIK